MKAKPHSAISRPVSDVSAGVGLIGLLGLFGWILICRNWGGLADMLALPGPRAPLAGPYAALAGLVFAGLPMVMWSIFIDKVHRDPATGIDWNNPRKTSEIVDISITKLAGLWATWAIIGFLYCVARWYWQDNYLFAMDVLGAVAVPLFVLSIPYVLWLDRVLKNPRDGVWNFGAMLIGREAFDGAAVKHHLRAWAVKGFFTAFMFSILPGGFRGVVETDFAAIAANPALLTNRLMELMFVIDAQIGTVGYVLTMRPLASQIRSANPYLAGWVAALACYPPFQLMSYGQPLYYGTATESWSYWLAGQATVLWIWGTLLVGLSAFYAWATFAFGIRFSNLTYRGVLTGGPYRFTRHPAYLSKNTFWWLASMPFLVTNGSVVDAVRNTFFLGCVSAIYYWRAKTEEKHLLSEDPKYREYFEWMERNALITRSLGWLGKRMLGNRMGTTRL